MLSDEAWRALPLDEAVALLSVVRAPWWVAGGWAVDLYLGRVTRAHKDLDIGIFRTDTAMVRAALSTWEIFEARGGALSLLTAGNAPRAEVNSLWCIELMLDSRDGEFWVFRRNPRIRRALSSAIRRNPDGIAYLAPEIQLLYKARATRAEDQADFSLVVPHLTHDAQTWLRESLMRTDPEHPWNSVLKALP
jgi:hypothetical protein